jgi:hypothetical protein
MRRAASLFLPRPRRPPFPFSRLVPLYSDSTKSIPPRYLRPFLMVSSASLIYSLSFRSFWSVEDCSRGHTRITTNGIRRASSGILARHGTHTTYTKTTCTVYDTFSGQGETRQFYPSMDIFNINYFYCKSYVLSTVSLSRSRTVCIVLQCRSRDSLVRLRSINSSTHSFIHPFI